MNTTRLASRSSVGRLLAALTATALLGCQTRNPPQTVKSVDLARYAGVWYEIAKFPVFFERGLVGVTAEYRLEEDGRIRVTNRGFKKSFEGKPSEIRGYAALPNPEEPGKLRVRFDPFPAKLFAADYWIVGLDENYTWAVVSSPSRKVLWILSRAPVMETTQYKEVVRGLAARGFDVDKLEMMPQAATAIESP